MRLVDMTCPHCGAALRLDANGDKAVCEHCGAVLFVDDEGVHIHHDYDDAEEAGYRFEKGRQRAREEWERLHGTSYQVPPGDSASGDASGATGTGAADESQEGRKKDKHHRDNLLWWVLGWMFLFPVPLMITFSHNRTMAQKTKKALTILAWIVYLCTFPFIISISLVAVTFVLVMLVAYYVIAA